jgi:hypothetical protein
MWAWLNLMQGTGAGKHKGRNATDCADAKRKEPAAPEGAAGSRYSLGLRVSAG